jgi:uncharacterized protein (DUF1778 family)
VPRADEPRVVVRLSHSDYALLEAAAASVNVTVAGLMRECSVRHAAETARAVAAGSITLRRQRIEKAVEAAGGRVVPAASLSRVNDPGWLRQQRVNNLGRGVPKRAPRS